MQLQLLYPERPAIVGSVAKKCAREPENENIAEIMEQIHTESLDKGCRCIKDDLADDHNLNVNEKWVLRICRSLDIKSTIKYPESVDRCELVVCPKQ